MRYAMYGVVLLAGVLVADARGSFFPVTGDCPHSDDYYLDRLDCSKGFFGRPCPFNDEERRCAGAALIRRSSGAARTNPNPNKPPTVRCYADDEGRYAHDCYFKGKTIWMQATEGNCTDDDGEADGMACFVHDM